MSRDLQEPAADFTAIGMKQADESFNERATFTLEQRGEEGLGIAIAHWAGWDGFKIMRVFRAALEDANFHDKAATVQDWIDGDAPTTKD